MGEPNRDRLPLLIEEGVFASCGSERDSDLCDLRLADQNPGIRNSPNETGVYVDPTTRSEDTLAILEATGRMEKGGLFIYTNPVTVKEDPANSAYISEQCSFGMHCVRRRLRQSKPQQGEA